MADTIRPDTAPAKDEATQAAYFAELDAINRETARLSTVSGSEAEWDQWEKWTNRVWREVEALPPTRENAEIKARAAWSIIAGDLEDLNDGQSTCCRLVRHIISGLGAPSINPYPEPSPRKVFASGFNAEQWLADFEKVGGGWVVRDKLSLVICPVGRTDEEVSRARELVVSLTDSDRVAIEAHLAASPEPRRETAQGTGDDELLAAWKRRKTAFSCLNALPFTDEPGGDAEAEKALWAIIDAAEEVIYRTPANTPEGVSVKLMASLGHTLTDKASTDALNAGDLLTVAKEDGLDWSEKLILSAIRSLKAIEHATPCAEPQPEPPFKEISNLGRQMEEHARHASHLLTSVDDAMDNLACDGTDEMTNLTAQWSFSAWRARNWPNVHRWQIRSR